MNSIRSNPIYKKFNKNHNCECMDGSDVCFGNKKSRHGLSECPFLYKEVDMLISEVSLTLQQL